MNIALAALFLTLGCGTSDLADTAPTCVLDPDGAYPTWGTFGESFFLSYCASCHAASAPERFGAPDTVTFDTEAEVARQLAAVRRTVLDARTMPKGGGVPEADLEALARYLDCLESPP